MLRFQIALAILLIGCVAFVSCDRTQKMLQPAIDDTMPVDDTSMDVMMDTTTYTSWQSFALPVPGSLEAAPSPPGTGEVHGKGARTVYINDVGLAGLAAIQAGTATTFPAGTVIIKAILDDANAFVQKRAEMMKSDDPMAAAHNGWIYKKYARLDASAEYTQVKGVGLEDAGNGCHGCHVEAATDSVFVIEIVAAQMEADMETGDAADGTDADADGDMDAGDTGDMDAEGMDADTGDMDAGAEGMDADTGAGDMDAEDMVTDPGADGTDAGANGMDAEADDIDAGTGDMDTGDLDAGDSVDAADGTN